MISYLRGNIISLSNPLKKSAFVIVDVGGVGYQVTISHTFLQRMKKGKEVELFTYFSVREDNMELFGFLSFEEVEFFKLLIGISGIGPKSALYILEKAKISDIQRSVVTNKPELLSSVSGLGNKTAEKIVLALKNSIKYFTPFDKDAADAQEDLAVYEALESLGFGQDQIHRALSNISPEIHDSDKKIKEALKILGKR